MRNLRSRRETRVQSTSCIPPSELCRLRKIIHGVCGVRVLAYFRMPQYIVSLAFMPERLNPKATDKGLAESSFDNSTCPRSNLHPWMCKNVGGGRDFGALRFRLAR